MANTSPQTLTGRVKVNPPLSAASDRYTFLNLPNAEPNLYAPRGNANLDARFLLASNGIGTRYWTNSAAFALWQDRAGFGTEFPNEKVTIVGNLSVTGQIFGDLQALSGFVSKAAGNESQVQFNSGGNLAGNQGFLYFAALSSIVVGNNNTINNQPKAGIFAGVDNIVNAPGGIVVGGDTNENYNQYSIIGGGTQNTNNGDYSVIVGGLGNNTNATYNFIGGGNYNNANNYANVIGGGVNNDVNGLYSAVLGGFNNDIQDDYSAIVGGRNNIGQKANTFILGSYLTAVTANYTYVNNISSQGMITGKYVSIGTNSTANALTVVGNISASGLVFGNFTAVSGIAGGQNTMVQYNDDGAFGGDAGFTYNESTSTVLTKNLASTTISFSALSANQTLLTSSITATSAFITLLVGTSSFAIPLYRY